MITEQQKRFADEYIIDLNGTRAYKAAYGVKDDKVAATAASRLLGYVEVQKYLQALLQQIRTEKVATATEVVEYLTAVMRGQSKGQEVVVEGTGDGCSEARLLEKQPSEKEQLKAAELLGKHFGMFTDQVRLTGDMGVQIVDDIPDTGSG